MFALPLLKSVLDTPLIDLLIFDIICNIQIPGTLITIMRLFPYLSTTQKYNINDQCVCYLQTISSSDKQQNYNTCNKLII